MTMWVVSIEDKYEDMGCSYRTVVTDSKEEVMALKKACDEHNLIAEAQSADSYQDALRFIKQL